MPGRPLLVVEGVRTDPANLAAGEPFTLTLKLANRGSRSVATSQLTVQSDAILPVNGSNAVVAGAVGLNASVS